MIRLSARYLSKTKDSFPIQFFIIFFAISLPFCSHANGAFITESNNSSAEEESINSLNSNLINLGGYLGYPISTTPSNVDSTLLNLSNVVSYQQAAFFTMMGAIPVNSMTQVLSYFLPSSNSTSNSYSSLNAAANNVYNNASQPYSTPSSSSISASSLIDQSTSTSSDNTTATYANDPVSQYLTNMLTTKDYTFCMSSDLKSWKPNNNSCPYTHEFQVMNNAIGTIPSPSQAFSYNYVSNFLSQLNPNTLLGPLEYNTESANNSSSSGTSTSSSSGLSSSDQNQAQQAANYVRWATFAASPIPLAQSPNYTSLYNLAITPFDNSTADATVISIKQAQYALSNYLASVRAYASQMAIPVHNFYRSLAYRMAQSNNNSSSSTDSNSNQASSTPSSQAFNEYQMATWRLVNPNVPGSKQWIQQINQASPATVQKETAILLAEINYQIYLMRMQEERLLLTESTLVISSLGNMKPPARINEDLANPALNAGS